MLSEVLCFVHGNKYVHIIIADNINTTTGPICTRNPYRPWTNIDSRLLPTPHYNLNKKSYQYEPGAAVITYVFWKETSVKSTGNRYSAAHGQFPFILKGHICEK